MTQAFNHHCQGESHKKNDNKPCQDYSISYADNDIAIAIVSDGHGGDRYFRSHFGSQFVSEIIFDTIKDNILPIGKDLFGGKPFTQVGISKERKDQPIDKDIERTMQTLFASIITQWYEKIQEHAKTNPLTQWEEQHVPDKYKQEFNEQNRLEKNYGCTLMVYVQTATYWFAFHLGDGKCVAFNLTQDNQLQWQEPILWDEACFLNTTTSICDSNAIEEFRYSYCGDGTFPFAVFLGSDGIDDSYGTPENLATFYQKLLQEMANKTPDEMKVVLEESLPEISRIGSQDDMTVACVYDDAKVKHAQKAIADYQLNLKRQQLEELKEKRTAILEKIKVIEETREPGKAKDIDLKYARNDLAKFEQEIQKIHDYITKADYESQLSERDQAIDSAKRENEELSHQLEIAQQRGVSLTNDLREEKIKAESTITELQQRTEQLQEQIYSAQDQLSQMQKKEIIAATQMRNLEDANSELKKKNKIFLTICITLAVMLLCSISLSVYFLNAKTETQIQPVLENVQQYTEIL